MLEFYFFKTTKNVKNYLFEAGIVLKDIPITASVRENCKDSGSATGNAKLTSLGLGWANGERDQIFWNVNVSSPHHWPASSSNGRPGNKSVEGDFVMNNAW